VRSSHGDDHIEFRGFLDHFLRPEELALEVDGLGFEETVHSIQVQSSEVQGESKRCDSLSNPLKIL
jgi:hypothetical protein